MQDPKRRQFRAVPTHAGELANLGEAEEIGYHGFAAAVLILPIAVETIAAGAGFAIDQRCRQTVLVHEPDEGAHRFHPPLCVAIGVPGHSQTASGH